MLAVASDFLTRTCFNPRAPGGARSFGNGGNSGQGIVSIHAPPEGRDHPDWLRNGRRPKVSIHAPPEGRDSSYSPLPTSSVGFNPRAPGGARFVLRCHVPVNQVGLVSIHAPPEGRDANYTAQDILQCIRAVSIHAPPEGRDSVHRRAVGMRYRVSIHSAPGGAR